MEVSDDVPYFTMVFQGDIATFKGNPFKIETPYGVPVAVSIGDVLTAHDELIERVDDLLVAARKIDETTPCK